MKDVEELLLEKGVSVSHIMDMKRTVNFNYRPILFYYKEIENDKPVFKHVPLSKIKSLGYRGSSGLSWFGHACCKGSNIDIRRSQIAFHSLRKQGLKEFQNFYNKFPVRLIYFEEDDFYAVNGDGTHRTLWAKITASPTILAEITIASKDPSAFEAFKNDFALAFKFKAFLQFILKFTPIKIELMILSVIRKMNESENINWHDAQFFRMGFDLYCKERTLGNSK
ncbi:hypothetical protein SRCM100169_02020 [Bacillus siamensis]|uniref:hypothetical protein n=1 Tax=Bacillus siamensis TaxID=659243 RepID=UPI0007EBE516|nr:hypothetical protein [Bacillus siamensis]OAZ62797.1 hypothetical protein SRCM100169_02020 [Bacillus siamensis]